MTDASPNTPSPNAAALAAPTNGANTSRPEFIPETLWDGQANTFKPEFRDHYTQLATAKQTLDERAALIPETPDGYQVGELKLADLPEGMQIKVDPADPRLTVARSVAKELGLDQKQFAGIVALDARLQIETHKAETARLAEETKLLGDNAKSRMDAIANWLGGLRDNGTLTPQEFARVQVYATDSYTVTALEKIMAKVAGAVPGGGAGHNPAPKPADIPIEKRWYP